MNRNPYETIVTLDKLQYRRDNIPDGFDNKLYKDMLLSLDILSIGKVYYDVYRVFKIKIRIDTRIMENSLKYLENFGFRSKMKND